MRRFAYLPFGLFMALVAAAACVGSDPTPVGGTSSSSGGTSGAASSSSGATSSSGTTSGEVDGGNDSSAPACNRESDFGAPERFDLGTTGEGIAPTFTADESQVFFASTAFDKSDAGPANHLDIFSSHRTGENLSPGEVIPAFAKAGLLDGDPTVTADGRTIIWMRRLANGQHELHVSHRNTSDGAFPADTTANIDQIAGSTYPKGLSLASSALYYVQYIPGTTVYVLHRAELVTLDQGQFGTGKVVNDGKNQPIKADDVAVSADERELYVSLADPKHTSTRDIYVYRRSGPNAPWGDAIELPSLHSDQDDHPHWISPDGCRLYFTSTREVTSSIYVAKRK